MSHDKRTAKRLYKREPKHKNGARVKTKPGHTWISFCPIDGLKVGVGWNSRHARCPAGHTWNLIR